MNSGRIFKMNKIKMNKTIRNIAVLVASAIALAQVGEARAADANPPERMTYQGYLVDGNGAPLANSAPTNYDAVLRVYAAKQGGTAIWAEQLMVTLDKGYFSALLGEGVKYSNEDHEKLSDAFDGADVSDRFIGMTVTSLAGSDTEIAPRLRLVTSPYAYTVTRARRLSDGSGNSNFFKDGAALKLGAETTPTLTLPDAGGATLVGKLPSACQAGGRDCKSTMPDYRPHLERMELPFFISKLTCQVFFNKEIRVAGNISSSNTDTVIGPSNNTVT